MDILNILIIIGLFHFSLLDEYEDNWRNYPTCKIGRLQSPLEIKEYESIYANNFSFVYQSYKPASMIENKNNYAYIKTTTDGGYINFERGGVIKQYQFKRAELYKGMHIIDGKSSDCELHLIHEKNLDFITNKNQYRSIQDANMYLVIVLRYSYNLDFITNKNQYRSIQDANMYLVIVLRYSYSCTDDKTACISDNGLLNNFKDAGTLNLNDYKIFQDKRAYFYEGSFVHIPCDENVNYYVVKDFFFLNKDLIHGEVDEITSTDKSDKTGQNDNKIHLNKGEIKIADKFGRPVYKNFMNYREVLGNNYFSLKINFILFLLMTELL